MPQERKDKAAHVLLCKYSAADYCRRIELKKVGIECSKIISKLELPQHMKNVHKLTLIENNEVVISQEINVKNVMDPRKWFPILFSAFDDHFFLDCEVILDKSGSGARISWKCISAGSVSVAQQFFVKMKLFPTDMNDVGTSLKWKGKVISIDQLHEKNLSIFSITMNTLRELTINKSLKKPSWKVNIVIQRNISTPTIRNAILQVISITSVQLVPSIYQIIEGTYQHVSGGRRWGSKSETVYSRNGSLWTRKVANRFEYSFTLGQEVTYQYLEYDYMSTITIENNKLINRVKQYLNGQFQRDITQVEEFSDNKMLTTDTWDGQSVTAVFKKVNG